MKPIIAIAAAALAGCASTTADLAATPGMQFSVAVSSPPQAVARCVASDLDATLPGVAPALREPAAVVIRGDDASGVIGVITIDAGAAQVTCSRTLLFPGAFARAVRASIERCARI